MAENQVYLIKSGQNSFVEETEAIIGISGGRLGVGTTNPQAFFHVTGDTKIDGKLTVSGQVDINSTTLTVDDNNIELNSKNDANNVDGGGITLRDGTNNRTFNWSGNNSAWTSSEHLHLANDKHVATEKIRALDADGLSITDDAQNVAIFVKDGGQVGINTDTPEYDLHVEGSGNFSEGLYVNGQSVLTGSSSDLGKWKDGTAGDIYYTGGKVGVANDTPEYNLHVSGTVVVDDGNFVVNGTSGNFNVEQFNVSGEYIDINRYNDNLDNNLGGLKIHDPRSTGELSYDASTEQWQFNKKLEVLEDLDVTGNVVIDKNLTINGLISNNASVQNNFTVGNNLTVSGDFEVKGTTTTVSTQTVTIEDHNLVIASNTGYNQLTAEYPSEGNGYAGLFWGTGDAGGPSPVSLTYQHNKGFNFAGDNVGVGVVDPAAKLDVYNASNDEVTSKFNNGGGGAPATVHVVENGDSVNHVGLFVGADDLSSAVLITKHSNVGIGTTSPAAKLDVNGEILQSGNTVVDQGDIGSEPNQIPLNKDLGSLAYMNAPQIEDLNVDTLELREIAAEMSETAVDVFVYDTRRDSDGGAWRSRTSHTSWYNEELNTATRGGRREFPAVAVIVAETNKVTIYDGDDPDLSMWMVFERGSGTDVASNFSHIGPSNVNLSSIYAVNSQICIAGDFGSDMLFFQVKLINDHTIGWFTVNARLSSTDISKRNTGTSFTNTINSVGVVSTVINDVAMTVLPNAPIDSETGLPIPTIAVATDGGVSVVRDDGSVVDITNNQAAGYQVSDHISFTKDNKIRHTMDNASNRFYWTHNIPDSDYVIPHWDEESDDGITFYENALLGDFAYISADAPITAIEAESLGNGSGLTLFDENKQESKKSIVAYVNSKYNTGWMPGDIKLAALSDTKNETVGVNESDELVTNGGFATDSDWTKEAGWSISGDAAVASNTTGNIYQIIDGLTIGQTYKISINVLTVTSGSVSYRAASTAQGGTLDIYNFNTETGIREIVFKADTTNMLIGVYGNGFSGTIDSVSLKQTGELITNGTFDNGTEDWEQATTNYWSAVGGEVVNSTATSTYFDQEINCIPGTKYALSFDITQNFVNLQNGVYIRNSDKSAYVDKRIQDGSTGSFSLTFVATETTHYVRLYRGDDSGTIAFDNISARLAEDDRSVNNNGLQIFGEINKTPVAPGADLVAYSGFSTENYLMQPYNSDLDFGTGDFCVMGWFKSNTYTGNNQPLFFRGRTDQNGYAMMEAYISTSGSIGLVVRDSNENQSYIDGSLNVMNQQWNMWSFIRESGVIKLYINGELHFSFLSSENINPSSSDKGALEIGRDFSRTKILPGSIALFRISATVPTAEQIEKIYRDEKPLFQDGAQATLYGTSDAVTALAYDDSENLLHVGSASGRSSFNGLKRVDNTTTAVSTAISATEGLVIEQ